MKPALLCDAAAEFAPMYEPLFGPLEVVPLLIAATCDLTLVGSCQKPNGNPPGFQVPECKTCHYRRPCWQDIGKDHYEEAEARGAVMVPPPNYRITFLFSSHHRTKQAD